MEIILKNSGELNLVPDVSELNYGELALNYAAGSESFFIRNSEDEIVSMPLVIPVEPDKIKEIAGIIDGEPSASSDNGIFYNESTNKLERWEHDTNETMVLVESYEIEVNDILHSTDNNSFYIFDTTKLKKIATDIRLATENSVGLVKGGTNVAIDINGGINVDLSDYAHIDYVDNSINNSIDSLSPNSILHYHRMDWLDDAPNFLGMGRYNSVYSVLKRYGNSPKLLMKNAVSVSQWTINGEAMSFAFLEMDGDDVLKTTYTVTPGQDAVSSSVTLSGYTDDGHCVVTKEVTVDNNRILNYDGLDISTSGGNYGTITNDQNGNNGLFEYYELLPNIENITRKSQSLYFGYYDLKTESELSSTEFKSCTQSIDVEVNNSERDANPLLIIVCSKVRENVTTDVNGNRDMDDDDVIKVYKVTGQSSTETLYSGSGKSATVDISSSLNQGDGTTTFRVEYITNARSFSGASESWLTYGISEINMISSVTENAGGSPSFTHEDYIPLTKPTLTLQYIGSDGIKHVVTYTSFYCTTETDNNNRSYAICVAEGVSSVFAWIFSEVDTNGWKFAIGSDYNTVKNKLLSNVSNASSVEPVEPGMSGGGDIPGQSEQGEVRP